MKKESITIMNEILVKSLVMASLVFLAIAMVLDLGNKTFTNYLKFLKKITDKKATIETVKDSLKSMISLLTDELVNHSNVKEKEDLGAHIAFLEGISNLDNISYIRINLEKCYSPVWLRLIIKRRFVFVIRQVALAISILIILMRFIIFPF